MRLLLADERWRRAHQVAGCDDTDTSPCPRGPSHGAPNTVRGGVASDSSVASPTACGVANVPVVVGDVPSPSLLHCGMNAGVAVPVRAHWRRVSGMPPIVTNALLCVRDDALAVVGATSAAVSRHVIII